MTPVTTNQTLFNTNFAGHIAAKNAAQAAKQSKDESRSGLTAAIRPLVRRLQASSVVSDAEKAALGITVSATPGPIGPPTTAPICSIEFGARLQHTLRFVDETTPTRKAKPAGVLGVEIWNHVGTTPPASESELRFVAVDTSTPFVLNFTSEDGGKTAYYWLRWVSPTGERGPWGDHRGVNLRRSPGDSERPGDEPGRFRRALWRRLRPALGQHPRRKGDRGPR